MRLREEFRDPWALLVAGVVGGAAWAVGIPPAAAAGVGAVVLGIKAVSGALGGREPRRRLFRIRSGSPEERWLKRAERAVRSFRGLASSARPGPIADRSAQIGERADETMAAMRRLASQASAVADALRHVEAARLIAEEARLADQLKRARDPDVKEETKRSLSSIRSQLEVHGRLLQASRTLLARMESGALGLEGLVARLAEVVALTETATSAERGAGHVDELAGELDALRSGLQETEELSRRALSAYEGGVGE